MIWWKTLVSWIEENGGYVHPSLTVQSSTTVGTPPQIEAHHDNNNYNSESKTKTTPACSSGDHRGIYTSGNIGLNETIIQVPLSCTIHGQDMPLTYSCTDHDDVNNNINNVNKKDNSCTRSVSSWLRCLAALMKEMYCSNDNRSSTSTKQPYFASLPNTYETLYEWDITEINEYLAGTRLPDGLLSPLCSSSSDPSTTTRKDPFLQLRQQYNDAMRPYLIHCNIITMNEGDEDVNDDLWYQRFVTSCNIMSTRSFYMNSTNDDNNDNQGNSAMLTSTTTSFTNSPYNGPYLIPIIDLINHADHATPPSHTTTNSINTTMTDTAIMKTSSHMNIDNDSSNSKLEMIIQQTSNNKVFCMRTIQSIVVPQQEQKSNTNNRIEIVHSYDSNQLSSYQFLSSFGFIPLKRIVHHHQQLPPVSVKVVIIHKQEVWDSCWHLIESGFTNQLMTSIHTNNSNANDVDDNDDNIETWTITLDKNRTANWISNDIVISLSNNKNENGEIDPLLSDELVTVACIPFLPKCAYSELFVGTKSSTATIPSSSTMFDSSILEDYFLGQLVGAAIIRTIQQRLLLYTPVSDDLIKRLIPSVNEHNDFNNQSIDRDVQLLKELIPFLQLQNGNGTIDVERRRLAYGLTIRLEEKEVLKALGNAIVVLLNKFDGEVDDENENEDDNNTFDSKSYLFNKKHKPNQESSE